ncbi:hypothetical protein IMG5_170550 [Ichthyophthirius multifiliis]|uniref:Transmembrane protein n=1 Tax=Ichthyophthirius multifiliis TaxID=5932 RepID=G0R1H0_ICHMU|nr:hypothetical protein IMG5_170550 [Ichthyophthirius multifiliis]EGR28671.1 hypothetical protein IMG5_170550 [Ichthyophthirius multifiliis]|eukprot:XP_004029907.1 hypothetical protein IMG5_170550 [Ichthyophthirius multifiliis]
MLQTQQNVKNTFYTSEIDFHFLLFLKNNRKNHQYIFTISFILLNNFSRLNIQNYWIYISLFTRENKSKKLNKTLQIFLFFFTQVFKIIKIYHILAQTYFQKLKSEFIQILKRIKKSYLIIYLGLFGYIVVKLVYILHKGFYFLILVFF